MQKASQGYMGTEAFSLGLQLQEYKENSDLKNTEMEERTMH